MYAKRTVETKNNETRTNSNKQTNKTKKEPEIGMSFLSLLTLKKV